MSLRIGNSPFFEASFEFGLIFFILGVNVENFLAQIDAFVEVILVGKFEFKDECFDFVLFAKTFR